MDLNFTPEEIAFRDEARQFFRTAVPQSIRDKVAEGEGLTRDDMIQSQRILNKRGWATVNWPVESVTVMASTLLPPAGRISTQCHHVPHAVAPVVLGNPDHLLARRTDASQMRSDDERRVAQNSQQPRRRKSGTDGERAAIELFVIYITATSTRKRMMSFHIQCGSFRTLT